MKIKSRCEKCNSNLHANAILEDLKSRGEEDSLCSIRCNKCGHDTQVLEKPYSQMVKNHD